MIRMILRLASLVVALSASAMLAAEVSERYIVVLAPSHGGSAELKTSDVENAGGRVEGRSVGQMFVALPAGAASALQNHPGVRYLQRIDAPASASAELTGNASHLRLTPSQAAPTWTSGQYTYDGSGNISAIGTDATPNGDGLYTSYSYDRLSRLIGVSTVRKTSTSPGFAREETYTYDAYGNMTRGTAKDGSALNYSISASTNQLGPDTLYVYDKAGNLTQWNSEHYLYDALGMLVRKQHDGSYNDLYIYTASDERVGARVADTWTWTFRDAGGQVLRQFEGSYSIPSNAWLWKEDYIYGPRGMLAAERPTAEGGLRHFHLDHLGTPRLITSSTGGAIAQHDYSPFGIELTSMRQESTLGGREEPKQFTGHERDFTGGTTSENERYVDYMHARYRGSGLGRFLSVDPVLDAKRALPEPQRWNRYSYVVNNPLRYVDPDGRADNDFRCVECRTPEAKAAFDHGVNQAMKTFVAVGATVLVARYAPPLARALFTWALGNPIQATHVAEALLSPPGPSVSIGLPDVAKQLATAERVGTALLKSDSSHRAASFGLDAVAKAGQSFELKGGDGVVRTLIQAPGEVNGSKGIFEYIVNKAGQVTHQRFIENAVVTGLPNK